MTAQEDNKTLSTKREVDWFKFLYHYQIVNCVFLYGLYVLLQCYWTTIFFSLFIVTLALLGVTAGSHRLWAHNSYTASTGIKIFLMLCQTLACHGSIYDWVRWHRLHHKYFGTDLDPYNPKRGLIFAHIGCLTFKLSEAQEKALEEIDMSDIEEDKVVMFQKKYYIPILLIFGLLIPVNAPAEYWGETLHNTIYILWGFRCGLISHLTNAIHSATLIWGLQPGEKYPADTNLVFILSKTNWLSYHYMAPWDYQTSEYGKYGTDCVSKFIRICAVLEEVSDLRTIDSTSVRTALSKSVNEKKPVTECLSELQIKDYQTIVKHF